MAKKGRTTVLKRQREVRKAEKAAMKREKRELRTSDGADGPQVASMEDLAAYGFSVEPEEAAQEE